LTVFAVVQALIILLFPAVAMFLEKRVRFLGFLGSVVMCYLVGILLVNSRVLPISSTVAELFNGATVILAIPLLLYSTDFIKWMKVAKTTMFSFFLCIISVLLVSTTAAFVFDGKTAEPSAKLSGMLVGVYTGGTANMNAIGVALGVGESTFPLVNGADVVFGGIYFLFLISVAQRLLTLFLPPFTASVQKRKCNPGETDDGNEYVSQSGRFQKKDIIPTSGAIILTLLICGVTFLAALGIKILFGMEELSGSLIILGITSLAIVFSFWKRIRRIEGASHAGNYLLLMFCVSIGTLADIMQIAQTGLIIFAYCGFVMVGAIVLHLILAAIFKIDADTVIITSTAAIFGPPFVAPIAGALKNRYILVSGLTTGLVGLALGNYLGIGLGKLLLFLTG